MRHRSDPNSPAAARRYAYAVAGIATLASAISLALGLNSLVPLGWSEPVRIVILGAGCGILSTAFQRRFLAHLTRDLPSEPDPRAHVVRASARLWIWLVVLAVSIATALYEGPHPMPMIAMTGMAISLVMLMIHAGPGTLARSGPDARKIFDELWLENGRRASSFSMGSTMLFGSALLFGFHFDWVSISGQSVAMLMLASLVLSFLGAHVWYEWRSED
ncbi:MAG: hypothetical protein AAGH68_10370 [Pseudomonadota bacterium]